MLRNHFFLGLSLALCGMLAIGSPSPVRAEQPPSGNPVATLPLAEVLRLYKASESKAESPSAKPPVRATISKFELSGRLLENAIDVSAHVELSVLEASGWVSAALFRKDAALRLTKLPQIQNGVLTVVDGMLVFMTDKPGTYSFDVGFLLSAQVKGARRSADVQYASAALAVLKLRFDENLFTLGNSDRIEEGDGYTLYPTNNRFEVLWDRSSKAAVVAKQSAVRPPIEPIINRAHASVVSTLEGRRIIRLMYALQFEGARSIDFVIPEKQRLEKVFVNGASVPFKANGKTVTLPVQPARAGDESAKVELLVVEQQGGYALSGRLDYTFPATSWNINDLYVTLSLPQVFNYHWEGGSLATMEEGDEVEYTQKIPTPGKSIYLHQQLLSNAATVRIAYTVDLAGSYYRAGREAEKVADPRTLRSE
jgi:hypothetical protein